MKAKLLWFLTALAVVLALHHDYLWRGFYEDDFNFLGTADQGFYCAQVTRWEDWFGFWSPVRGWFYRPVFLNYFAIVSLVFGPSPVVLHAGGLILHAAIITSLGWLVWRLTGGAAIAISCAAAFTYWPNKSDAVWWIASHSTLLAALFSLASVHCWLSWRQANKHGYYWCSLFCMWLALCSKNDAVSLPVALLAIDTWHDSQQGLTLRSWLQSWHERVLQLIPFAFLFVVYIGLEFTAARYYSIHGDTDVQGLTGGTTMSRVFAAGELLEKLWLKVLPFVPPGLVTVVSCGALIAIAFGRFRNHALCLFLIWGLAAALPVPLAAGEHALSDRFTYIPAMPIACAFVLLAWETLRNVALAKRFAAAHVLLLVWAVPYAARFLTLGMNDLLEVWISLLLTTAAIYILWRMKLVTSMMAALLVATVFGTQLAIYAWIDYPVYLLATIILVAIWGWKADAAPMAWCAGLLVIVLWRRPEVYIPIAVVGCALCEWLCRYQRATQRPLVTIDGSVLDT